MGRSKIQLSQKELELAADPAIILTKNRIIEAVVEMFGRLSEQELALAREISSHLPGMVLAQIPKISKGEKYQQLPWVMLDFPRHFEPAHTFAIRHFFWWGNNFSVTLQVSGKYKEMVVEKKSEWPEQSFICVHPSPWEHHFEDDNYLPLSAVSDVELQLKQKDFLKLTLALPLDRWNDAPVFLLESFRSWISLFQR